jgi:UDP-GlcNAc:undecaprenyl-phosphate/decaprenyl-phosphate GlcNAc-1-phosphate transferase
MDSLLMALLVLAASTAAAAALVPPSRLLARRAGAVDQPGPRKVHSVPTPRLGGVAVFLSFTGLVLAGWLAAPRLADLAWAQAHFGSALDLLKEAPRVKGKLLAVLGGAALCFAVGLVDDVRGKVPVPAKLLVQALAAGGLVAADVRVSFLPYEWLNVAVTMVWLVGITNAFNLLDNMDGLSAGVAAVASSVLLINAWLLGEFFISLLLLAFIGSLLGFLFFNTAPASVFLGDCGSLFIGFVMGSLTLLERYVSHASSTLFPVLMPVVVLAVPIMDTLTVVAIRLRERRPIYVGDKSHLSHRLVALGFSSRGAVGFLHLTTFFLGLGAASLTHAGLGQSLLVLLQTVGFVALLLWLMRPRSPVTSRAAPR